MRLIFEDSAYLTKMVVPYNWLSMIMAIKLHKCDHIETKSFMISVRNSKLIEEVFNDCHNEDIHEAFEKAIPSNANAKLNSNSNENWK